MRTPERWPAAVEALSFDDFCRFSEAYCREKARHCRDLTPAEVGEVLQNTVLYSAELAITGVTGDSR